MMNTELQQQNEVYERLFSYNFQEDKRFMQGWLKVRDVIPASKIQESLLKAEVFFYSREIEPVDCQAYQQWLQENKRELKDIGVCIRSKDLGTSAEDANRAEYVTHINNDTSDVKTIESNNDSKDDVIGNHPQNFMELVEMLQKGMKLPDTEDSNIEPLNEEPTPCNRDRPKKPWEET